MSLFATEPMDHNPGWRPMAAGELVHVGPLLAVTATFPFPDSPTHPLTLVAPGTIKWAVSAYPEISIEPFEGRWVVAPLDGKARVTGSQIDLFTGTVSPLDEEVDFSYTTRLDVTPDTIKVTPLLTY